MEKGSGMALMGNGSAPSEAPHPEAPPLPLPCAARTQPPGRALRCKEPAPGHALGHTPGQRQSSRHRNGGLPATAASAAGSGAASEI